MCYKGFDEYGLNILAGFDRNPANKQTDNGKPIYNLDQLESFCRDHKVLMGIITVPQEAAQTVCDRMIACGIKAIWTFAPGHLDVPAGVMVHNENMATSLALLSVHLQAHMREKKEK